MAVSDPWKHRGAGMRCQTCMWYVPKMVGVNPSIMGRCRRRCPTLNGYPAVFGEGDWCGDHKLDENAV